MTHKKKLKINILLLLYGIILLTKSNDWIIIIARQSNVYIKSSYEPVEALDGVNIQEVLFE